MLPVTRRTRRSVGPPENTTMDLVSAATTAIQKKSRSKSIGPGGLDALKNGTCNRRASLAAPARPPPRSILKPTVALLPEIPPHRSKPSRGSAGGLVQAMTSSPLDDNNAAGTRVAVRTEEDQQAAAQEREDCEKKQEGDRREARRKSLANRRVSFAAEATLHTFHEVEYMQDSTTSTDSTRCASSLASISPAPILEKEEEGPIRPPEHDVETAESPGRQQDPHQKRYRRSSGIPPLNFNNPEDDTTLTTTMYSSDSEPGDGVAEIETEEMDSNEDSDEEDGTMMTVEADEMTSATVASPRSDAGSTVDLDENLRLAARRATEVNTTEDEEFIPGFGGGWGKKSLCSQMSARNDEWNEPIMVAPAAQPSAQDEDTIEMDMSMDVDGDMDMTKSVGGILHSQDAPDAEEDEDMSMDATHAIGRIMLQSQSQGRRKSLKSVKQFLAGNSVLDEQAMSSFTTEDGGIRQGRLSDGSLTGTDLNEDMSMEITAVIGGVLGGSKLGFNAKQTEMVQTDDEQDDEIPMDMTVAAGQIIADDADKDGDADMSAMDMTLALGSIIKAASRAEKRPVAKKVMEKEEDEAEFRVSALVDIKPSLQESFSAAINNSPESLFSPSRSSHSRLSPSQAVSPSKTRSPTWVSGRPSGQVSTLNQGVSKAEAKTSAATPPIRARSRSSSPMRLTSPAPKTTPRSVSKLKSAEKSVFRQDPKTGSSTPRVILTPQWRRLSGTGADRPGLGSPRVAELFDRRGSLGEATTPFSPTQPTAGRRTVAFADPRAMEEEIDRELQEEEDREDSRSVLQQETDASETAPNLREMIQRLSPKKKPSKGRKSLHIGSAKGVLGKRPPELDDDEEDSESQDSIKLLKGYRASPVKNVHLQPPSSEVISARKTRSERSLGPDSETSGRPARQPCSRDTTPEDQSRFKDVENDQPATALSLDAPAEADEAAVQEGPGEEAIRLKDFLDMIKIRFMELTTTKRRRTIMPSESRGSNIGDGKDDLSLERCVTAGACTVPMLEMYQHACRNLKDYMSEGRKVVRKAEKDTFALNPPLFYEYMSATPEVKSLMDHQFKNVKTHARLESKAMWYAWRTQLLDGLKDGLDATANGMDADDKLLRRQQDLLDGVLPPLVARLEKLEREHEDLEALARELADCDPAELQETRYQLRLKDAEIAEKTQRIAKLKRQLEEAGERVEELLSRKRQCLEDIRESEKIREECRGWSSIEISTLKAKVEKLEKQHGWSITGAKTTVISMAYRREIELVFDVAAFQAARKQNASVDLFWYIAQNRETKPVTSTVEREFFLQCIRDHIRSLPQAQTSPSALLRSVSGSWDVATALAKQIRLLNVTFPTRVDKVSGEALAVKTDVLVKEMRTKVEVALELRHVAGQAGVDGLCVRMTPSARVVYGEAFNAEKMVNFLKARMEAIIGAGAEGAAVWSDVLLELRGQLVASGRK